MLVLVDNERERLAASAAAKESKCDPRGGQNAKYG